MLLGLFLHLYTFLKKVLDAVKSNVKIEEWPDRYTNLILTTSLIS